MDLPSNSVTQDFLPLTRSMRPYFDYLFALEFSIKIKNPTTITQTGYKVQIFIKQNPQRDQNNHCYRLKNNSEN